MGNTVPGPGVMGVLVGGRVVVNQGAIPGLDVSQLRRDASRLAQGMAAG